MAARPAGAARRGHHPALALAVIAACQLMVVLDATIVNIALPHIQQALGFSTTEPVLGGQRLHAHLRRAAAARRPGRRHPRPPPGVHLRHPAVHPRLAARRPRPELLAAARRPRPPGRRRRHRLAHRARADHHHLPRGPGAQPRVRRLRAPSRRAAARSACSPAACSPSGSTGAGCSSSTCRSASCSPCSPPCYINESERQPGQLRHRRRADLDRRHGLAGLRLHPGRRGRLDATLTTSAPSPPRSCCWPPSS